METAEEIIRYLTDTYQPEAIIVYGSFADGSAGAHSDFDALVIADHEKAHDASRVGGVTLDVFVEPPDTFRADYDPEAFVQVWDGQIVLDRTGAASRLRQRVLDHIARLPPKSPEAVRQAVGWCEKMAERTGRGDAEGFYRWHWLLSDSLEIWSDAKGLPYFGPKKALRRMEREDPEAFRVYAAALREMSRARLDAWIALLRRLAPA